MRHLDVFNPILSDPLHTIENWGSRIPVPEVSIFTVQYNRYPRCEIVQLHQIKDTIKNIPP